MHKGNRRDDIQAIDKSLELLQLLAAGNDRLRIGELADRLELGRNKVLMLLVTLECQGMVRWDHDAKLYRPGQKLTEMETIFLSMSTTSAGEPKKPIRTRSIKTPKTLKSAKRHVSTGHSLSTP